MKSIKLLIFDDDSKVIDDFYSTVKRVNATTDNKIMGTSYSKKHILGIRNAIKVDLNGIIIDMKWKNNTKYGEIIIKEAKKHMIPIVVYSGNPYETEENDFFKFFLKSVKLTEVFDYFFQLYDTNIFRIFGLDGMLIEEMHSIFWNHASKDILSWNSLTEEAKSRRLMRYIVSRMSIKFLIADDNLSSDSFSSNEFYISPLIKEKLHPGLVLQSIKSNERFIILNASCDMEREIPNNIVLCRSDEQLRLEYQEKLKLAVNEKEKDRIKQKFMTIVRNGNAQYQYLPPYKDLIKEHIFDFERIVSLSKNDLLDKNKFEKCYTINPEIYKDIQYRFSHYFARQGQPELDNSEREKLTKLITE